MSILPSFAMQERQTVSTLEVPVEYGIDFATGQLTGKTVNGLEAIKVWIWLCLNTERFRYQIYSRDYGAELEQYIGQTLTEDFLNMDARDMIEEALTINPFITGIDDFQAAVVKDKVTMKFSAVTLLGEVEINV